MQLQHHLAQVSEQLAAAAALGDDRTKEIAGALAAASASAVRLALLHAVTEAADEITAALLDYPGSPIVGVHTDGEEISLDVRPTHRAEEPEAPRRDDGDANARISLRLSESLKTEIDAAADRDGVSVNTWLVRAAYAALQPGSVGGGGAFTPGFPNVGPGGRGRPRRDNQRITGWINS
jgi:predicted HicB family RNase H-like nuclease